MKIFLVEDDDAIGTGLKYSLEKEGYEVLLCTSKEQALDGWEKSQYALCILDINLPDGNGYDICKYIKSKEDVPIIFLTASDAEVNVVMGLEMGADDYICKPFRINELMARIRTVLRRTGKVRSTEEADQALTIQHIKIYPNEVKVCKLNSQTNEEEQIELTALEYRLLLTFCNNRGVVLSRTQLLEDMWDISGDFVNDNTLTVYIKRLRDKIEKNPANPTIIKTVRGMGYIIEK
ncbi:MAG: response regulator transcription factor [Pseudobutyrivibrio ruminis]|uniref:Stage 0 sporulation protein A homolog n=1 Tax=Pseudobutyrivibrio ruminis TaxID=46206 RepID=A0A927YMN9_9FIRM|nr:response regulator transcription factor [Pseudobutyrivibrio ruminis]